MSSDLSLSLCVPHKARGRLVPAFYTVNGEGMCKACYGGAAIDTNPALAVVPAKTETKSAAKENHMPTQKEVDWPAVQRDRDAGIPVSELVTKYKVSNPTIYTRTHANGKKRAGGGQNGKIKRASRKGGSVTKRNGGRARFAGALEELRAERERIDAIILYLEAM
jgi:hypothetical protein